MSFGELMSLSPCLSGHRYVVSLDHIKMYIMGQTTHISSYYFGPVGFNCYQTLLQYRRPGKTVKFDHFT